MSNPKQKSIAVIGGGWAGVASAIKLLDHGHQVTLFESSHFLGGRARGVFDSTFGMLDNGQHLMLGAYTETLKLITRLNPHVELDQLVTREPLYLMSADGELCLQSASTWPAPLSTLIGLIKAQGIGLSDKLSMIRLMLNVARQKPAAHRATLPPQPPSTLTVLQWLHSLKQSKFLIQNIWQPLCIAMLNTPLEHASQAIFARVLRDSLGSHQKGATDIVLARTDLSSLAPQKLTTLLACRLGHTVRQLQFDSHGITVDHELFDACVIATPPYSVARLIQGTLDQGNCPPDQGDQNNRLLDALLQFTYAPITTCYMRLAHPYCLPAPMMMLREDMARGQYGQWVFTRAHLNDRTDNCDLAVVISNSAQLVGGGMTAAHDRQDMADRQGLHPQTGSHKLSDDSLVKNLHQQISNQLAQRPKHDAQPLPVCIAHRVITEKRATFVATPSLIRPSGLTHDPRVVLAGDWTDTGYPAVIEGAVLSGQYAATALIQFFKT